MANKVRDWINQNSAVTTIAAVVLIILALLVLMWSSGVVGGPKYHTKAYYYDIKTHKLFIDKIGQLAPINAPSGPNNGVIAHVFSCTSCDDKDSRFIGWLEKSTPKAKKIQEKVSELQKKREQWIQAHPDSKTPPPGPDPMMLQDQMAGPESTRVKTKDGSTWVSPMSKAGDAIMSQAITKRCSSDQKIQRCYP